MIGWVLLGIGTAHAQSGTNSYAVANLAADTPGVASFVDAYLINPFGLVAPASKFIGEGEWWAANNGSGTSTLYYADGSVTPLTVTIPAADGVSMGSPTGVVDIKSDFAFVTLDGTISLWKNATKPANAPAIAKLTPEMHRDFKQPCVNCHVTAATIKVSNPMARYSGATLANYKFRPTLFVANSNSTTIEAYDASSYAPVTLPGTAFKDASIPAGFTPNNIQYAGGKIWVAYANGTPTGGYVDGYSVAGKLMVKLQQNGQLNDPWGLVLAPSNFGAFSSDVLVGNTEAGNVAAFDAKTGNWIGNLKDSGGNELNLPGLWALTFGTGNPDAGPTNVLYFTTGTVDFTHGLFGSITAN
jgi:uncharacterized protein (TIGR03118 family)